MRDNAGNDEAPLAEGDLHDGEPADEPGVEDIDEYTEPESYDEGPYDVAGRATAPDAAVAADANPDVFLDVPVLKVDEIDLDVENLRAHVSLQAEVLDLLKLNVGADVALGRVHLGISGVEAQAQLRVRLDNVSNIISRVLTTLDRNPEILHELARGVGSAVQDVGGGARQAVGELGTGAGRAVRDVGRGAGAAVQDVGRGVGSVAEDVGAGAGRAVQDVGSGAGRAVEDVGGEAGRTVGTVSRQAGDTTGSAVGQAAEVTEAAGGTVRKGSSAAVGAADTTGGIASRAESAARSATRGPGDGTPDRTARSQSGARKRRVRTEDGKLPPRPSRRRTAEERQEPP
ncbi:hypothetical protein ACPF8X_02730 [Streptomyces sp. G35A]